MLLLIDAGLRLAVWECCIQVDGEVVQCVVHRLDSRNEAMDAVVLYIYVL